MEHKRLKGGCCDIVNGGLCIVQLCIGDFSPEVHLLQRIHFGHIHTNGHRADLFVVTDDYQLPPHIQNGQGGNVRLTGFVDNDNVKPVYLWIQALQRLIDGHDPCRDCRLAFAHQFSCFRFEFRRGFACSLADALHR